MTLLGTALRPAATRVMLLGSGELRKEVAIECQRLGVEVDCADRRAGRTTAAACRASLPCH